VENKSIPVGISVYETGLSSGKRHYPTNFGREVLWDKIGVLNEDIGEMWHDQLTSYIERVRPATRTTYGLAGSVSY
jgi:hypothetical protein